jgi:phospholipid/cholesterol/gamma-HCH transport system ATP-binding protein
MMILYDEPFTGQDPISMGVLVSLIRQLNDASQLTSVVVSHDVRETASIADFIYIIADGRVMAEGAPGQVMGSAAPWVNQFVHGLPDGPVHFHYPALGLEQDLFA